MSKVEIKQFDWLYPDLIPRNELISILKQRYIKTESLELLDKDELVELYNKYIIPLPQRKYRVNRRGQEMSKKQVIASKKRRLASSDEASDDQPKSKRRSAGNLLTSFDLPSSGTGDRLKPPPSCINFEKKKIKLNNSSKTSTETLAVSSSLNKLKINKADDVKEGSISVKKIKLTDSSNNKLNDSVTSKEDQTLSVTSKEDKMLQKTHSSNDDAQVEEKQRKITKISWP
ncbi:ashwin-like [Mercenaria mercenaria]|uniref:ashwin-like n=1 Tax=Mercenaria mercenaria TaxID=6596 RepID=UPI00234EA2A8|nr:ashwin-like [Mercenaria mercenaria]